MRRRNAASDRSRTSSALSTVVSVSRARRFSGAALVGLGATIGRAAPGRRARGASSSSASSAAVRVASAPVSRGLASSSPKRFLASCSAFFLVSSSCRRRSSSSRLRASAASRSRRSMASRASRTRASSSAILRSSASRRRASERAWARALCSAGESTRSTTPDGFVVTPAGVAAVTGAAAALPAAVLPAAILPAAILPAVDGLAAAEPAGPASALALAGARLLTFSTRTALVRPWLKLWRTMPVSPPRDFSVSVLVGAMLSFFSPVFSVVSTIQVPTLRGPRHVRYGRRRPGSVRGVPLAPETSCLRGRPAALHVSHLAAPMPNPIAST